MQGLTNFLCMPLRLIFKGYKIISRKEWLPGTVLRGGAGVIKCLCHLIESLLKVSLLSLEFVHELNCLMPGHLGL